MFKHIQTNAFGECLRTLSRAHAPAFSKFRRRTLRWCSVCWCEACNAPRVHIQTDTNLISLITCHDELCIESLAKKNHHQYSQHHHHHRRHHQHTQAHAHTLLVSPLPHIDVLSSHERPNKRKTPDTPNVGWKCVLGRASAERICTSTYNMLEVVGCVLAYAL